MTEKAEMEEAKDQTAGMETETEDTKDTAVPEKTGEETLEEMPETAEKPEEKPVVTAREVK